MLARKVGKYAHYRLCGSVRYKRACIARPQGGKICVLSFMRWCSLQSGVQCTPLQCNRNIYMLFVFALIIITYAERRGRRSLQRNHNLPQRIKNTRQTVTNGRTLRSFTASIRSVLFDIAAKPKIRKIKNQVVGASIARPQGWKICVLSFMRRCSL